MCIYVCIYVYTQSSFINSMHLSLSLSLSLCVYIYIYVYVYVCMYIQFLSWRSGERKDAHTYIRTYVKYAYIYIYMYIYIYIYIYVLHIHIYVYIKSRYIICIHDICTCATEPREAPPQAKLVACENSYFS